MLTRDLLERVYRTLSVNPCRTACGEGTLRLQPKLHREVMMTRWIMLGVLIGAVASAASAQVPAGSTGLCKDGTYSNAPKKSGACSGHKGVQTWYATVGAAPEATQQGAKRPQAAVPPPSSPAVVPSTPVSPVQHSTAAAPASVSRAASQPQAAGGGPGMVWVNTSSKTYHCQGTAYYGKTKQGKYLSEAVAKAEGDHADHGKLCAK